MKYSLDHLPEGKRRELAFVVETLREGFAFATARRTMPALRGGRLLKIILFGSVARGDWVEDPVGRPITPTRAGSRISGRTPLR